MSTVAPPRRPPVLAAVDIVVGVLALVFGLVLGLYLFGTYVALSTPTCRGCDTAPLTLYVVIGIALTVLLFALGLGFFIVRQIQRRYGWYFPVAALVLTYLSSLGVFALIGGWAKGVSG